jgi:hypothetical protein
MYKNSIRPPKVAICISIRQDHLEFIDQISMKKGYSRTGSVEYVISQFIEMIKQKAMEFQKRARAAHTDQENMKETIYRYQQGRPITDEK